MKKFPFIECPRVFKRLHEPIEEIEQEPNENEEKIKVPFVTNGKQPNQTFVTNCD